jgi:hypothetical protein
LTEPSHCHRRRDVLLSVGRAHELLHYRVDMKGIPKDSHGRCGGNAMVVLALTSLLFPSSASVLCIAPGGHVSIEDINAPCCAPSDISASAGRQPDNGFSAPGKCQNCTDLFMTPNGRDAVSESCNNAAANPLADECPENHLLADTPLSLCRPDAIIRTDGPILFFSSVPLRC